MDFYTYFKSYEDYFWQWEDSTEVIAIPDGSTIAYKQLVIDILDKLALQGIPPFGALLLIIIATNPTGKNDIDHISRQLYEFPEGRSDTITQKVFDFLRMLTDIPSAYKTGEKRLLLFQTIFEDAHNRISYKNAKEFLRIYKLRTYNILNLPQKTAFNYSNFTKDFKTIAVLSRKYESVEDLLKKMTNLQEVKESLLLEENKSDVNGDQDIITQLLENSKTFHTAALIKRIWAGLHIPVHNTHTSQQPLGGISDLTNKGEFDKLLISEYANEDLIFLSRLANNEALYMQREAPPTDNDERRLILIDISLKNWGTPKIMAFATALAIIHHPKTSLSCDVYAIGEQYYPIQLESLDTIIEGLQLLDGSLDAAEGFIHFFDDHPESRQQEVFVITEASTLKHNAILRVANEYRSFIDYWIQTQTDGNIDIFKRQKNSKKHLQRLVLPLQQLWEKQQKKPTYKQRPKQVISYPILFRNSQRVKKYLTTEDGTIFQISKERMLLRFYDPGAKAYEKGWEVLYENLPIIAGDFAIGTSETGAYILLIFDPQTRNIILLNVHTGDQKTVAFKQWRSGYGQFIFKDQKFHYRNYSDLWTIDIQGVVKKEVLATTTDFNEENERNKEAEKANVYGYTFFKNVKAVFINERKNIVLNTHELHVAQGGHVQLNTTHLLERKAKAVRVNSSLYSFSDQSTIEIKPSGMIILNSSNPDVPNVFIPSILNVSLGLTTEDYFAGNTYYYKNEYYRILLEDLGEEERAVKKALVSLGMLNGSGVMKINDQLPKVFTRQEREETINIVNKLQKLGAEINYSHYIPSSKPLDKIKAKEFFSLYIDPFIQNILNHETSD